MSNYSKTSEEEISQPAISSSAQFWIYLSFLIPSIVSSIFVLYHMLSNRNLRSVPSNHITLILLCFGFFVQLTLYPGMLHYYRLDAIWDRSIVLCLLWGYIDYVFYVSQMGLMALAAIQRHILIFHDRWMSTRFKRICIHYLPIIVLLNYYLLTYAIVFFFPTCGNITIQQVAACATSCMWSEDSVFAYYDPIVNQIMPIFILTFFNIMLLARVVWRKYRVNQRVQWRKHRKMAVQFSVISSVYIICIFPYATALILYFIGIVADWNSFFMNFALIMSYLPGLLLPGVCSIALPEIRDKVREMIRRGRNPTVVPLQSRR